MNLNRQVDGNGLCRSQVNKKLHGKTMYTFRNHCILFFLSSACPSDLSLKSLKPSSSGPAFLSACLCSADLRIIPNRISQGIIGWFSPFSELFKPCGLRDSQTGNGTWDLETPFNSTSSPLPWPIPFPGPLTSTLHTANCTNGGTHGHQLKANFTLCFLHYLQEKQQHGTNGTAQKVGPCRVKRPAFDLHISSQRL